MAESNLVFVNEETGLCLVVHDADNSPTIDLMVETSETDLLYRCHGVEVGELVTQVRRIRCYARAWG